MHLTVLAKWETQMLLEIKSLTRHNCFGAENIRYSSLRREEVQQFNRVENNVDRQKLWDPGEWEAVSSRTTPFLYHPNSTFDLRHMFIGTSQVNQWTTWQRLD